MVEIMLINTHNNFLNIVYKQKVSIYKINRKNKDNKVTKTYEYKEVNIPVEILNYWKSILGKSFNLTELYLVTYIVNGVTSNFITPLKVEYSTDLTGFCNSTEVPIVPERIINIPIRKHGKATNPKYFIRHNKSFSFTEDFVTWIVNPYLEDPVLNSMGLVSVGNQQVLTHD